MSTPKITFKKVLLSFFLLTLICSTSHCKQNNKTDEPVTLEYDDRYIFLKDINEHSKRTTPNDQEIPSFIFPYVVALLNKSKKIQCSGTIISPIYILTAAHCSDLHYVYAGKYTNGTLLEVIGYIKHPLFSYKKVKTRFGETVTEIKNDIGIVSTFDSLLTKGGRPISLNLEQLDDVVRRIGTSLGYGKRMEKDDLSKIRFTDIEIDKCFEVGWSDTICGITPIYNLFSSGICSGDSGGPLVYEGKLLGIGSLGQAECGTDAEIKEVLTVYTLVSSFRNWIMNVTKMDQFL